MSKPLAPVSASERLPVIDALRGIAVLGILIMNVKNSSFPRAFMPLFESRMDGVVETVTYWAMEFLVYGKFFTMFTFLFGLGMAIQFSRAITKENEKKFPGVYVRRMVILFLFGVAHEILIWEGSVLVWYPVMGLPLLLLRKIKPKPMLILAFICLILTSGVLTYKYAQRRPGHVAMAEQQAGQKPDPKAEEKEEKLAWERCNAEIKVFREGSHYDILHKQMNQLPGAIKRNLTIGWYILGMFLLGVWAWRKGLFHNIREHQVFLKRLFRTSLAVGALLTGGLLYLRLGGSVSLPEPWLHFLYSNIRFLSFAAMCLAYVSGILLLFGAAKPFFLRLMKPIQAVGRAGFSNYVFQNILMGFIFYNYGFKLMGETGTFLNLLICLGIFALQIPLSVLWFKYFRFGPLEWLWRLLTYARWQPIKKQE